MNDTTNVIALKGIRKVFQTDEVETHALSDVHLNVQRGEYGCPFEHSRHHRRSTLGGHAF